ncbi:MAG: hypothetical protein K5897_02720 [Eubacterium sp.]|nr:hypothetical protein [Eubacterium sp.]
MLKITGVVKHITIHGPKAGFGFIGGDDGVDYYFNSRSIRDKDLYIDDFREGDEVEFLPSKQKDEKGRGQARDVVLRGDSLADRASNDENGDDSLTVETENNYTDEMEIENQPDDFEQSQDEDGVFRYYRPGFPRYFDRDLLYDKFLKSNSGEDIILDKLSKVLYISKLGKQQYSISSTYEFCLAGVTKFLKQYIRGQREFIIVLAYFATGDWQEKNYLVERQIRLRKEVSDRDPLVNFYVLISNAVNLRTEIDRKKGGTGAAIIPFSFEEIIKTTNENELIDLLNRRFGEYYYENNMLGETGAIDDDALLFGDRGMIADGIVSRCERGENSGIFGLRRSGKSSVLNAVCRRLDRADIRYIKVESRSQLEHISWKTALFEMAKKIRITTANLEQSDDETSREFEQRLNLNHLEEDYEKKATVCFVEDVKLYCRNLSAFVIAIDEVELITYNTASSSTWNNVEAYTAFWGALRDCGCSLIVCGVNSTINEVNTINFKGAQGDNPMYGRIILSGDSSKTYLPAFTDEQTKYMINSLGAYSNIDFSDVYVEINREFGGQPYAVRQFCSYVFENVKHLRKINKKYIVGKATVIRLLEEFSSSAKGSELCSVILQHVQIFSDEYALLKKIALAPEKYKTIENSDVRSIDHLCKYGLIEYDYGTQYVAFRIRMIKDYIVRTQQKDPIDMSNDERREYIQGIVADVEKKLKKYIRNYYFFAQQIDGFRRYIIDSMRSNNPVVKVNIQYGGPSDPHTCEYDDFFDHKKYIMYFSSVRTIIVNRWNLLGTNIQNENISKTDFSRYMKDLNAGRNDADHYDAEDLTNAPDEWEISDDTMKAFNYAYGKLKPFIDKIK